MKCLYGIQILDFSPYNKLQYIVEIMYLVYRQIKKEREKEEKRKTKKIIAEQNLEQKMYFLGYNSWNSSALPGIQLGF